jgi:hypothetical protein
MRRYRVVIVLVSVALFAALVSHVVIDILGDYLLAHDTYDDVGHSSRAVVGLVTFGLSLLGIGFCLRAALREARGSENAFCLALRGAIPRNATIFTLGSIIAAAFFLACMEGCDAIAAGKAVDDLGDLFGGSVPFGGTIVAVVAICASTVARRFLLRLARTRIIAAVVVAFLRRCSSGHSARAADHDLVLRLVVHVHFACRRIAGRAPPLHA